MAHARRLDEEGRTRVRKGVLPLVGISLAGFSMYGCNNVLMTLLPSYSLDIGSTMVEAGLQGTVFLLVAVLMRFYFGPLADRRGTRFVMVVGAASFVVSSVMLVFCTAFWQILLVRCVQAVGLSAFWPCAVAAVASIAPQGKSGLFIGAYRFATAASLLVGPLAALMLVGERGYAACFLALAGLAAMALVLSLCFAPSDGGSAAGRAAERASGESPGTAGKLRGAFASGQGNLPVLLCVTAVVSLGYGLSMNFVVTFVEGIGSPINAGLFFSCFSLGGLIANPLAGWAADRCDRRILLAGTLGCMGAGIGLIAFVQSVPSILLAAGLVAGLGSSGSTIVVLSTISARVDERFRASALAVQQNVVDLGIACASTLFGWLFAVAATPEFVFAGQAAFAIASAFALLVAKRAVRF
ncbi:MFS transporter [Arabiibacter massiliensis]|uniref:MFS transporter n=1 Tax=Arabiibacter massiliensis TaxID=1870985 RepID=UPI001E35FB41|nr:MFS transporter [Arabiibacter massiliensis]